jgi:hypothetical protein
VDDSKWEGLESLDVGSKFLMFEKGGSQDRDTSRVASDRSPELPFFINSKSYFKDSLATLINTFTGPRHTVLHVGGKREGINTESGKTKS